MKTFIILMLLTSSALAQPFPWPRPEDWGPEEQRRVMPPWPQRRPWGPQVVPCIYYGDCRGPRPDYRRPRFEYPPRYDLYEDE